MRVAILAILAFCSTARAAQAELTESGGFAQLGLVQIANSTLGGLSVQAAPGVSIGYRTGQSVVLLGLAFSASKSDVSSLGPISSDGGVTSGSVVESEHFLTGTVSPSYRRYFFALEPDALVPFIQLGLDLGLQRLSFAPANIGPATTWLVGGRVAIGGEYLVGGHLGVEVRAELQGLRASGNAFSGGPDQSTFIASLGGAGAINLHW
jgi:hypothetical protein